MTSGQYSFYLRLNADWSIQISEGLACRLALEQAWVEGLGGRLGCPVDEHPRGASFESVPVLLSDSAFKMADVTPQCWRPNAISEWYFSLLMLRDFKGFFS